MEFHEHRLANGLQIVAELNSDVQSVAVGFFVRTGSRDETDEVSGVSHFLEHMVFKGTAQFSAEDVNRIFDEIGAKYNASTSEEVTLFYAAVLPEYLVCAFELLSALMRPTLREEDFNLEKQVILEEIGMYDDLPTFTAYEQVMERISQGIPWAAVSWVRQRAFRRSRSSRCGPTIGTATAPAISRWSSPETAGGLRSVRWPTSTVRTGQAEPVIALALKLCPPGARMFTRGKGVSSNTSWR